MVWVIGLQLCNTYKESPINPWIEKIPHTQPKIIAKICLAQ